MNVEEEYDEVEDSYEIRKAREKYEQESAKLLEYLARRDEMIKLLKLATRPKIPMVREAIGELDEIIERTENIIAIAYKAYELRQQLWRDDMKLMAMCDAIKPELLKHVAENNPEKLEELEAMLSDDYRTH